MGRPVDALTAHWRQQANGELVELSVNGVLDEDGEALRLYYRPYLSMRERIELYNVMQKEGSLAYAFRALMLCAKDAEGNKAFGKVDEVDLLDRVDGEALQNAAMELVEGISRPTREDAEKNLKTRSSKASTGSPAEETAG